MPSRPRSEQRPLDVIGCATDVVIIATGEIDETFLEKLGRVRFGIAVAKARTEALMPGQLREIAKEAARKGWG